jgi:non-canonical purine NTP pyrophosphatase (RdgB/HAM1 family)
MVEAITFITGNPKKVVEVEKYLSISLNHTRLDLAEIQSIDLAEVVSHKAKEAYRLINSPVLIEDVSLSFGALNGTLPGPFIKWFLEEIKVEGLIKMLEGNQDRRAIATVCYGLYDGKALQTFMASINGKISEKILQGEWDFGFNTIFIPDGYTTSWSQMNEREQFETSFRRLALEKLEKYLNEK